VNTAPKTTKQVGGVSFCVRRPELHLNPASATQ
jgi:hypothetical protein